MAWRRFLGPRRVTAHLSRADLRQVQARRDAMRSLDDGFVDWCANPTAASSSQISSRHDSTPALRRSWSVDAAALEQDEVALCTSAVTVGKSEVQPACEKPDSIWDRKTSPPSSREPLVTVVPSSAASVQLGRRPLDRARPLVTVVPSSAASVQLGRRPWIARGLWSQWCRLQPRASNSVVALRIARGLWSRWCRLQPRASPLGRRPSDRAQASGHGGASSAASVDSYVDNMWSWFTAEPPSSNSPDSQSPCAAAVLCGRATHEQWPLGFGG